MQRGIHSLGRSRTAEEARRYGDEGSAQDEGVMRCRLWRLLVIHALVRR